MARFCESRSRKLTTIAAAILALIAGLSGAVAAEEVSPLYDRPVLVIDPGMHTAFINRVDTDAEGRFAVTGADDKTVRIWSLDPLTLEHTIRIPAGPGAVGKIYAVAMSPDGEMIAAGGWTYGQSGREKIYLFNRDGDLLERIDGVPSSIAHLAFSPDGRFLAAGLGGSAGIRVYGREQGWVEIAGDTDYGDSVYGLAFDRDGRLATISYDGHVRLYDRDFTLIGTPRETTAGKLPHSVAFSPDGTKLAVGFDSPSVALYDGNSLAPLVAPDTNGIDSGGLSTVAWSSDGEVLYAAGRYDDGTGQNPVVAWRDGGRGERQLLDTEARTSVTSLAPLPGGRLLVAASDPHLAIVGADGTAEEVQHSPGFDPRGQRRNFAVSADGTLVDFGYEYGGESPARFDVTNLKLIASDRPVGDLTEPARQEGLEIENWINSRDPTLNGLPIDLKPYERSRSLAIHPDGRRFVLGADWSLRAFSDDGDELWNWQTPGTVWAVNISGDGRLVVAAYNDGTIRWHRMDDGRELLAFFPMRNRKDWVAWTPEGFYGATAGAYGVLNWYVNRGWDAAANAYPVSQFRYLRRPEALHLVLQELETARALGLADMVKAANEVKIKTGSKVAPGALLHVLAVGVGTYGEDAAHLKLDYADRDARDVANALIGTQSGLYADVRLQVLPNDKATRRNILAGLGAIRRQMEYGEGRDVAVFMFSGHGAMIDGSFYLLPYDVDARADAIADSAISVDELKKRLTGIAGKGRVLVLLDACRSGAAMADGTRIAVNSDVLRAALKASNIDILTSSKGSEVSLEDPAWENGAFTEVLMQALGDPADVDRNGLLSINELTTYLREHLPPLTGNRQAPGMSVQFDSEILVSGL